MTHRQVFGRVPCVCIFASIILQVFGRQGPCVPTTYIARLVVVSSLSLYCSTYHLGVHGCCLLLFLPHLLSFSQSRYQTWFLKRHFLTKENNIWPSARGGRSPSGRTTRRRSSRPPRRAITDETGTPDHPPREL